MLSLLSLVFLLFFLSFLGLAFATPSLIKRDIALLPALGFTAVIGLAYVISANLKVSGAYATTCAVLLLSLFALFRAPFLGVAFTQLKHEKQISKVFLITLLPLVSLLIPAWWIGFNYFYGSVNFDFFYNSQDAWFLKLNHVLALQETEKDHILPLSWSAGFQGRFGVSLLAAFFSQWFDINPLQFNSLLLNCLVVIFALTISVFSRDFFQFNTRTTLVAVFFAVMSAAYSQGYSYYLLGQLSGIPVFVLYCIYLKRLLDNSATGANTFWQLIRPLLALSLLFNVLYILYAILSFYALALSGIAFVIYAYQSSRLSVLRSLFLLLLMSGALFGLARLFTFSESLMIIHEWINTSAKVATGTNGSSVHTVNAVIVFSEYLKDSFLALLFGITSYPSSNSVIGAIFRIGPLRNYALLGLGLVALFTFLASLSIYIKSNITKSAKAVILALSFLTLGSALLFFITFAPYGIFKVQTWFMPLLMPLFIFAYSHIVVIRHHVVKLSYLCGGLLALNILSTCVYLGDFLAADSMRRHANVRGVTGNKDIEALSHYLQTSQVKEVALFLANGIEAAWLANFNRDIHIKMTTHNLQPLADKEFPLTPCSDYLSISKNIPWIMPNPKLVRSDILDYPAKAKILYENNSFVVIDPSNIETAAYFGQGMYPIELAMNKTSPFSPKFRWVEKGAEVYIYSKEAREASIQIEVIPGYVETKESARHVVIKSNEKNYPFTFTEKTTLIADKVKLHKGLTCLTVESPDEVKLLAPSYGLMRQKVPYDPRLINFAISRVSIINHS